MRWVWRAGVAVAAAGVVGVVVARWLRPQPFEVPDRGLVLGGVTVVNPGLGRDPDRRIVVRGARIAAIVPSADAPSTRYAGSFVLPGLIDMHVHFGPHQRELFGLLFLAHGVTTVRDAGDLSGTVAETRQTIRNGELPGPTIFSCGPMLDGEPATWPGSRVVLDADQGRAAVEQASAAGVDCIKVYGDLGSEALAGVRAAAAARRLPLIGHVPHGVQLADAGLSDVQHLTGVPEPLFGEASLRGWAESWLDLSD